jgi:hydrogenase nickel incorporation protein HypA/HybF
LARVHELALIDSIVRAVDERIAPEHAACVRLQIGRLAGVEASALRFGFELCARGTACEGAALEIDDVEGRGRCRSCGAELEMRTLLEACACGGVDLEIVAGQELRIKEVEVS